MMNVGYSGEGEHIFSDNKVFTAYNDARDYLFGVDVEGGFEGALVEGINGVKAMADKFRGESAVHDRLINVVNGLETDSLELETRFNDLGLSLIAATHYFESLAAEVCRTGPESDRVSFSGEAVRLTPASGRALLSKLVSNFKSYRDRVYNVLENRGNEVNVIAYSTEYAPSLYTCAASLETTRIESSELLERIANRLRKK